MDAEIRRRDPAAERWTDERCYIDELSNSASDAAVSIARARVSPGVTTRWHALDGIAERYVILDGAGRVEIGALPPHDVGPGDVVLIPPGCRQRIANTGAGELVFLALCTPRFRPEAYRDVDDEPLGDAGTLLVTDRLLARRIVGADLDAMHAVYGDAEAMRWVGDGVALARDECRHWIDVTHRNYARYGYGMSSLVLRDAGTVAGFCGLVHPGGAAEPELKYALLRGCWGHGLAAEAAAAMLAYGAATFALPRIIATVAPEHRASQRVLEKAGMRLDSIRRNADGSETQVYAWRPGDAPIQEDPS